MKPIYTMWSPKREVVGMALTEDGYPAKLIRLFVLKPFQGLGHGHGLLRVVCVDSDRERKHLLVSIDPEEGMDRQRLMNFFKAHGFVLTNDGTTMKREFKPL